MSAPIENNLSNSTSKKLLLLGGTADGRILAERLHQQGIAIIYSIAGLVRAPTVACEVVSGGFTQFGGLEHFIVQRNIGAILDVTHPYAAIMSATAIRAARHCGIACWRFHREQWQPESGDHWQCISHLDEALPLLTTYSSVLLTVGQLTQSWIDTLTIKANHGQQQWLRTAVKPSAHLPCSMGWIKAIGPFSYEAESALMKKHNIDVLLSKNSGGDATVAKLHAARALNIPVVMLDRPALPAADQLFVSRDQCSAFVEEYTHAF